MSSSRRIWIPFVFWTNFVLPENRISMNDTICIVRFATRNQSGNTLYDTFSTMPKCGKRTFDSLLHFRTRNGRKKKEKSNKYIIFIINRLKYWFMILFYGVSLFTGNVLQLFLLPSPWILQSLVWSAIHLQTIDSIFFISAHFLWYVPYCHFHFVIWFVLPINPIIMIRWNRRNAYGKDKNHNSSPLNWNIAFSIGFFFTNEIAVTFDTVSDEKWIRMNRSEIFWCIFHSTLRWIQNGNISL